WTSDRKRRHNRVWAFYAISRALRRLGADRALAPNVHHRDALVHVAAHDATSSTSTRAMARFRCRTHPRRSARECDVEAPHDRGLIASAARTPIDTAARSTTR